MKINRSLAMVLAFGLLAGCQDLTVDDRNRPSLQESLATVSNMETSVGTAWKYFQGGVTQDYGIRQDACCFQLAPALTGLMDELTFGIRSASGDLYATTMLDEPRTEMDHRDAGFWINRRVYQEAYTALATCHDIRMKISEGFTWANVDRTKYFCKMIMGFTHLYLGTMFDKALLVPDDNLPIDVSTTDFRPHDEIVEFAKKQIREGIDEAKAAPTSTTPLTWINGVAYSNVDMIKVAYGMLARAEVWKAVTPEQREDKSKGGLVDWQKVIQYVDSSIASTWTVGTASQNFPQNNAGGMAGPNFTFKGDQIISGTLNGYPLVLGRSAANNDYRMHHKALGPGDTTGAWIWYLGASYQTRNDTAYASPDKRLPQKTGTRHVSTSTSPNYVELALPTDGKYFQLLANSGTGGLAMLQNNAPAPNFRKSSYQFIRFGNTDASRRSSNCTRAMWCNEFQTMMTPEEQRLLKAEAYMRLGQPALAVPLINVSRTDPNKGALPPVAVNGPTQLFPQCVPHSFKDARVCGDLWDALLWEKKIEGMGVDLFANWADWRAFGLLESGSVVMFPPHSRELETLGLPYYTYGPGLPGSADAPPCTPDRIGCVNYKSVPRLPRPAAQ